MSGCGIQLGKNHFLSKAFYGILKKTKKSKNFQVNCKTTCKIKLSVKQHKEILQNVKQCHSSQQYFVWF